MLNYLKSEWYRISHGKEIYVFVGILCAIVLAANVLLRLMAATPDFPYATVRFSLSNVIASLGLLFFVAGIMVWVLFADEWKDGTFKNALAYGISRRNIFVGKCLVSVLVGLVGLMVVLVVYIGSAVLLLEGSTESVVYLLKGVATALPFTIACVVLAVAVIATLPKLIVEIWVWLAIVSIIPAALNMIGLVFEPVAVVASWMPANFFAHEVIINQSGTAQFLWDTPEGLTKCLVSGFVGVAVFAIVGLWRVEKTEL
ncbi:MAG: ABC transporter permease [Gordonibacter sp.]|nr:ABC transporter permease [Gordonibacter sp.]